VKILRIHTETISKDWNGLSWSHGIIKEIPKSKANGRIYYDTLFNGSFFYYEKEQITNNQMIIKVE
jgi:hypothetical protein